MTGNNHQEKLSLRLSRNAQGDMIAHQDGVETAVQAKSCFPWNAPKSFFSLRDGDNVEVALVTDLGQLDEESRAVLEHGLREVRFTFDITRVKVLRLEYEIRHWEVECAQGPRTFQTRKDDWPHYLAPHGLLITDVSGDIYAIPDWTALDRHSRKELAYYID